MLCEFFQVCFRQIGDMNIITILIIIIIFICHHHHHELDLSSSCFIVCEKIEVHDLSFFSNQTKFNVHLFYTYIKPMLKDGPSILSVGWDTAANKQTDKQTESPITVPDRLVAGLGEKHGLYEISYNKKMCLETYSGWSSNALFLYLLNSFQTSLIMSNPLNGV